MWLRFVLEQYTGVLTGSIYNDSVRDLKGEGVYNSSMSVIKTHGLSNAEKHFDFDPDNIVNYDRVVVLIRHPRGAIISEVNRRFTEPEHIGHFDRELWRSAEVQKYDFFILISSQSLFCTD